MIPYCFRIYIFYLISVIFQLKCTTLQGNASTDAGNLINILSEQTNETFSRSCYDLQKFGSVVCEYINGSLIEMNPDFTMKKVDRITFTDVKYLPRRALMGFSVQSLHLDDPEANVDENFLDGMVSLGGLRVIRSSIKVIPDFKFVNDSIEGISFNSSPLMSLEGKNLQNLPFVNHLNFLNDSIGFIHPDVFKGTENVHTINLLNNLLTYIPPNLLNPMKSLKIFLVARNNLLHIDGLFSVAQPMAIYLFSNNITDVDSAFQQNRNNVISLHLSRNPIRKLTEYSFNKKIPNIKRLYLNHCELQNFNIKYFSILYHLEILELSYNLIEDSDECTEGFDFGKRDILFEMNTLNLMGNKLKSITKILKYKKIAIINVAKNQIQYLSNQDFIFVHETEHLEFQENQIGRIDTDTFIPIRKYLNYLDLSSNSIASLNGSIRYLSQLKCLYLSDNLIESFATDEFTGLVDLTDLNLEHNHIKALWQFHQLPFLKKLNIRHNNVELIKADEVPRPLQYMGLTGNPFKCDCRLQPFALRSIADISIIPDVYLCFKSDIESNLQEGSDCPRMCSCGCTNNRNDYYISVDCSSKNLTSVPLLARNSLTQVVNDTIVFVNETSPLVMKQNVYPLLDIKDRVLSVNLENNFLETLEEAEVPSNIFELYLSNNSLRWLPDSLLRNQLNLRNVSLSRNPWNCDCNTLTFKKWLTSNHQIVHDIENVRCGISSDKRASTLNGKVIWRLSDIDLCPKDIELIVSVSLGVLIFLILCLTAKILYTRYNLNIKIFLYSHGFTFVKEEDLDYDKVFDAFISFSHKDGEFVTREIITVIEEKDPSIDLCIHYRHFRAGEFIYNNIIDAVRNSKRTVLILSKHFLESDWCLFEFKTAHTQALEDKVHRIIVIKCGDLPNEIDPAIKAYLDSTTYLTWGEKNFWNKLLYALPTGDRIRKIV